MKAKDEKEFLITQYVDGTLSPHDRAQIETSLTKDAELRDLLQKHRSLDDILAAAMPLPDIQWDSFARKISAVVAHSPLPTPSHHPSRAWIGITALAACVLLCVSALNRSENSREIARQNTTPGAAIVAQADVIGPQTESQGNDAFSSVQLGTPPSQPGELSDPSNSVVIEPSHVFIASAVAEQRPVQ
jgi:anti-sigma-K factor RskA